MHVLPGLDCMSAKIFPRGFIVLRPIFVSICCDEGNVSLGGRFTLVIGMMMVLWKSLIQIWHLFLLIVEVFPRLPNGS